MTTFNIIGDIHGRTCWKELIDENEINIFVGDYFDPYDAISFDDLRNNFMEIIALKHNMSDNVVLLYGNHDYAYLTKAHERNSRYDSFNAQTIKMLFLEYQDLFHGVAYAIGEDYIVTHAGITSDWKQKYLPDQDDISPSKMEKAINKLWTLSKSAFGFKANADFYDFYGESPCHSPIWVRPQCLEMGNLYRGTDVFQIVGHTQFDGITEGINTIFVDCLGSVTESKKIEGNF